MGPHFDILFDILFHTMTRIALNHGKCRGKVGKNKKVQRMHANDVLYGVMKTLFVGMEHNDLNFYVCFDRRM